MRVVAVLLFICIAVCHGRVPKQIIGGRFAENGEFPFQVSIRSNGQHICGGVIIDELHILTAAHCMFNHKVFKLDPSRLDVSVGSTLNVNFSGEKYTICSVSIHEDFISDIFPRHKNDIAMLLLNKAIEFHENARPIKLRTQPLPDGSSVKISGWGSQSCDGPVTVFLRNIELTTMSNSICSTLLPMPIFSENLCAGSLERRCSSYGDSGSGLIAEDELVGIAVQGVPSQPTKPTVFIRISQFVSWIKKTRETISHKSVKSCQLTRSSSI